MGRPACRRHHLCGQGLSRAGPAGRGRRDPGQRHRRPCRDRTRRHRRCTRHRCGRGGRGRQHRHLRGQADPPADGPRGADPGDRRPDDGVRHGLAGTDRGHGRRRQPDPDLRRNQLGQAGDRAGHRHRRRDGRGHAGPADRPQPRLGRHRRDTAGVRPVLGRRRGCDGDPDAVGQAGDRRRRDGARRRRPEPDPDGQSGRGRRRRHLPPRRRRRAHRRAGLRQHDRCTGRCAGQPVDRRTHRRRGRHRGRAQGIGHAQRQCPHPCLRRGGRPGRRRRDQPDLGRLGHHRRRGAGHRRVRGRRLGASLPRCGGGSGLSPRRDRRQLRDAGPRFRWRRRAAAGHHRPGQGRADRRRAGNGRFDRRDRKRTDHRGQRRRDRNWCRRGRACDRHARHGVRDRGGHEPCHHGWRGRGPVGRHHRRQRRHRDAGDGHRRRHRADLCPRRRRGRGRTARRAAGGVRLGHHRRWRDPGARLRDRGADGRIRQPRHRQCHDHLRRDPEQRQHLLRARLRRAAGDRQLFCRPVAEADAGRDRHDRPTPQPHHAGRGIDLCRSGACVPDAAGVHAGELERRAAGPCGGHRRRADRRGRHQAVPRSSARPDRHPRPAADRRRRRRRDGRWTARADHASAGAQHARARRRDRLCRSDRPDADHRADLGPSRTGRARGADAGNRRPRRRGRRLSQGAVPADPVGRGSGRIHHPHGQRGLRRGTRRHRGPRVCDHAGKPELLRRRGGSGRRGVRGERRLGARRPGRPDGDPADRTGHGR